MTCTRKLEMRVGGNESQNFIAVSSAVGICSMYFLDFFDAGHSDKCPFYSAFTPWPSPWSIP